MAVRHDMIGFTICLAVGLILSLVASVLVAIADLPNGILVEGRDPFDVRPIVFGAVAFAAACASARALARRRVH